ncbi:hypothetical protein BV898_16126 [Hypsibius exemplaris]|uniref:VPS37 C-terminal domain-containing protein n=1 Tax=Hypsibius exemplaris TaxID=2072580 RepID=A0A9X6RLA1_HYPEX|nr:hypothetical protein BV898_16126 [Hypsibius exemplaris]
MSTGGGSRNGAKMDLPRASFDRLNQLDTDELKAIFHDPNRLDDSWISEHPIYRNLKQSRDELIAGNRSLAEFTLSREDSLNEAREKFVRSQNLLIQMKKEAEEQKRIYESRQCGRALGQVLPMLETNSEISQDTTDHLGQQLVSGAIGIDAFMVEFLSKSSESHLRRVKVEKLRHYMATGSFDGSTF